MQTWALIVDSYRLLKSRMLFWMTLVISAVIVVLYGSVGFDDTGTSILFGVLHFDDEHLKAGSPWAEALYLGIFSNFILGWWLAWAANILALVSTSSIFTDFMAQGAIDLVLAKPIHRIHVFFVKYLGSLFFVLLQVGLFSIGVFLCVGTRIGVWNWSILLSIPVVVIFFSYLYSVNVLLALLTRSTIAALLLTILLWFGLFLVQTTESALHQFTLLSEITAESEQKTIDALHRDLAFSERYEADTQGDAGATRLSVQTPEEIRTALDKAHQRYEHADDNARSLSQWHAAARGLMAVCQRLPKRSSCSTDGSPRNRNTTWATSFWAACRPGKRTSSRCKPASGRWPSAPSTTSSSAPAGISSARRWDSKPSCWRLPARCLSEEIFDLLLAGDRDARSRLTQAATAHTAPSRWS